MNNSLTLRRTLMEEELEKTSSVSEMMASRESSYADNVAGLTTRRQYASIAIDIQKTQRRREKKIIADKQKADIARKHLDDTVKSKMPNFKLPDEDECEFDFEDVGLGSSMRKHGRNLDAMKLKEKMLREMMEVQPVVERKAKMSEDSTIGSSHGTRKLRFHLPDHVRRRQKSEDEEITWLNDRIQESSVSVRFELPMDMRDLTGMDVMTYLSKFCKIPPDRMLIYKRFYKKHIPPRMKSMIRDVLPNAVHDVMYNCVTLEDVVSFLHQLTLLSIDQQISVHTFACIAATAERILYLSYAETKGRVNPGELRSFTECADFNCLKWKLNKINISKSLKLLLYSLG